MSQAPVQSSGLTTTEASLGGSSSKRKAAETLESVAKRPKMNSDDSDADIDVAVQTGLYAAEMFASNLGVNYLLNIIVIGGFFRLSRWIALLSQLVQTM
jgi:hypothetical protein